MNISIIRKLAENIDGGMRKLAANIGMSEANLHRCVKNNKIQAGDLEKIARVLQVPVSVFFEEGSAGGEDYRADGGVAGKHVGHVEIHNAAPLFAPDGAHPDDYSALKSENDRLKSELIKTQSDLITALKKD